MMNRLLLGLAFGLSVHTLGYAQPPNIDTLLAAFREIDWDTRHSMTYSDRADDAWKVRLTTQLHLLRAGKEIVPQLTDRLSHSENPHERALVAEVLGLLDDPAAAAPMIEQLKREQDATARLYMVEALGRLGESAAIFALETAKSDEDRDVANYANDALQRLAGEVEDGDTLLDQVLTRLDPEQWQRASVGEKAPDFTLTTTRGESVRLSDYRGQRSVALYFMLADW